MYQVHKLSQNLRDNEIARLKKELQDLEFIVNELQDVFAPEDEARMYLCLKIINANTYLLNDLLTDKPYYQLKIDIKDTQALELIRQKLAPNNGTMAALERDISSRQEYVKAGFLEQEIACVLLGENQAKKLMPHKNCCTIG